MSKSDLNFHINRLETFGFIPVIGVFLFFSILYSLTIPVVHSEAYDAYEYALAAEIVPLNHSYDPRAILFHDFNRIIYLFFKAMGFEVRSFTTSAVLGILVGCGALILFARALVLGLGLMPLTGWVGALTLGLTYGYWRYVGEAEVYVPSLFLIMAVINLVLNVEKKLYSNWFNIIASSILAAITVLYYQPLGIIILVAVPIYLLFRREVTYAITYSVLVGFFLVIGISVAYWADFGQLPSLRQSYSFLTGRSLESSNNPNFKSMVLKSVLSIGHIIFSSNWLFGIQNVNSYITNNLPGCVLNYGVTKFAAEKFFPWIYFPIALIPIILILLFDLVRHAFRLNPISKQKSFLVLFLLWLLLVSTGIAYLSPGSAELWILILPPLIAIFCAVIVEPNVKLNRKAVVLLLPLSIGIYNYFGGIGIWLSDERDSFLHETKWIQENANESDVVIFNVVDYRIPPYLKYHSNPKILVSDSQESHFVTQQLLCKGNDCRHSIENKPLVKNIETIVASKGRIFATDDFFEPNPQVLNCRNGKQRFDNSNSLAYLLRDVDIKRNVSTPGTE